ncbi:MAG: hypothetical protein KF884_11590 [Fimbriimonadaceae bacterium]|nr:hypothetical protein [Fimbriimonadaceae bacterium]QYK58185.1 MAG: hypothetical protein KF884_11590 [Fimbriimonadaceae bacterium]
MKRSLEALLSESIDYAGLFPPAKLELEPAFLEYAALLGHQDGWIVDRFVCPVSRLEELAETVRKHGEGAIPVTVVGTPIEGSPTTVRDDLQAMSAAAATEAVEIEAYEVKIPSGEGSKAAAGALERLAGEMDDIEVYAELGWGPETADTLHEAARAWEEIGFKARTGGLEPSAFPSVRDLASFIYEVAAIDTLFKFTAGLHDPIRHFQATTGATHHGFLNVLVAAAFAVAHEFTVNEIMEVLAVEDPGEFVVGADQIAMRGSQHVLSLDDIEDFRAVFGGFGSCSVREPLDGLQRLGLLTEAPV